MAADTPTAAAPDAGTTSAIGPLEPVLLIVIGLAEALALGGLLAAQAPSVALVAAHVVALAAVAALLALAGREERDTAVAMLALVAGAVIGPLGPIGAGLVGLTAGRAATPGPLIREWYERIALSTAVEPEVRQCDDVSVGRSLDLGNRVPSSFPTVMQTGPLAERQTVLGHIARHFHPAYLPTLRIALESPEAVLRVQAAAVAAHIAPAARRRCTDHLAAAPPDPRRAPEAALDLLGELDALSASGLLDDGERRAADALRRSLGDGLVEVACAGPLVITAGGDIAAARTCRDTLERLLVDRRRFAELRALRSADRVRRRHPTARFRRIGHMRRPVHFGKAAAILPAAVVRQVTA